MIENMIVLFFYLSTLLLIMVYILPFWVLFCISICLFHFYCLYSLKYLQVSFRFYLKNYQYFSKSYSRCSKHLYMISITLWRAEIGQFYHRAYTSSAKIVSDFSFNFQFSCQKYTLISVLLLILQLLSCDIDLGFRIFLSIQKNSLH